MKALLLLTLSLFSVIAQAKNPCWMVQIQKQVGANQTIRGTGYVIKFAGKLFVRTASHVTLGNTHGVQMLDCDGAPVSFVASNFITHNMLDDELIEINSPKLSPLGIYNPYLKLFLVPRDVYASYSKNKRRVDIEGPRYSGAKEILPSGFISPDWIKRNVFAYKKRERSVYLRPVGEKSYEALEENVRKAQFSDLLLADFSVIPGESGSPIIGWTPYTSDYWNDYPLNFFVKVGMAIDENRLLDDQGQTIDATINQNYRSLVYIKGHVTSYHLNMLLSRFLSAETFPVLQKEYVTQKTSDISSTSWKYLLGISYREFHSPGLTVTEMDTSSQFSGDGSGHDGGDGSGHDGGDGSGHDGGDGSGHDGGKGGGKRATPAVGILYNSVPALSFKLINSPTLKLRNGPKPRFGEANDLDELEDLFKKEAYLIANWNNFVFLNNLQKLNPQPIYQVIKRQTDLHSYFQARFGSNHRSAYHSCRIKSEDLKKGVVSLEIQLGAMASDEHVFYSSKIENFKALRTYKTKTRGSVEIDFSQLFGLDLSFIGNQFNPEDNYLPYIQVRAKNYKTETYQCSLI